MNCLGDLNEKMTAGRVGSRRVNGRLALLIAFMTVVLSSCMFTQLDSVPPETAVLPPAVSLPTGVPSSPFVEPPSPTDTAAIMPDLGSPAGPMPTAIARLIGAAFPTPQPTMAPIPSPTTTPCLESGRIVTGTYESESAGISPYRVYLPPCYDDSAYVYPTLYMLPGNIHTDSVWDYLGLDDAAEKAIKRGEIPPLIIVMAGGGQLSNFTSGGPWSYESVIMDDLIPHIERTYCSWQDPAGRAIGGMSRGGYWALEIAFRHADQFASVGGHSAALYDLYGGPDVVPQSTGLANDLGDLRIYFDVGENDWVIPNVQKLHEDMELAGKAHVWIVNEGWHADAYWASHTAEYITWYSEPWSMQRESYPLCTHETTVQSQ